MRTLFSSPRRLRATLREACDAKARELADAAVAALRREALGWGTRALQALETLQASLEGGVAPAPSASPDAEEAAPGAVGPKGDGDDWLRAYA